jgi:ribosomal protein L11 methyltransferase
MMRVIVDSGAASRKRCRGADVKSWLRVVVKSPSDDAAGLIAEGLVACGGSAVLEKGSGIETYLPDGDAAAARERVREQLEMIIGSGDFDIDVERVPDQDWLALWRAGLAPRHIGRIIVSPTWSEVDATANDIVIRIDPQMAFGTGEHASTRGVLHLMQRAVEEGDWLLDVGTGSAILAIAAVRLGAAHVLAVESDADAVLNAQENADRNGVAACITLRCALVDPPFLNECGAEAFDGILANVISGVLKPLLPSFQKALTPGGWMILSGILLEEADVMREAADANGFEVEAEHAEEQWWSVLLRRR